MYSFCITNVGISTGNDHSQTVCTLFDLILSKVLLILNNFVLRPSTVYQILFVTGFTNDSFDRLAETITIVQGSVIKALLNNSIQIRENSHQFIFFVSKGP